VVSHLNIEHHKFSFRVCCRLRNFIQWAHSRGDVCQHQFIPEDTCSCSRSIPEVADDVFTTPDYSSPTAFPAAEPMPTELNFNADV
jgi:hypothetical protein